MPDAGCASAPAANSPHRVEATEAARIHQRPMIAPPVLPAARAGRWHRSPNGPAPSGPGELQVVAGPGAAEHHPVEPVVAGELRQHLEPQPVAVEPDYRRQVVGRPGDAEVGLAQIDGLTHPQPPSSRPSRPTTW